MLYLRGACAINIENVFVDIAKELRTRSVRTCRECYGYFLIVIKMVQDKLCLDVIERSINQ